MASKMRAQVLHKSVKKQPDPRGHRSTRKANNGSGNKTGSKPSTAKTFFGKDLSQDSLRKRAREGFAQKPRRPQHIRV